MRLLRPRLPRRIIYLISTGIVLIFIYNQFLSYTLLNNEYQPPLHIKPCENAPLHSIDVVYTWVNGSEERFQKELQRYVNEINPRMDSYTPQRFNDKDELKYSLRSLEKHMPWFRRVFIVTNGQIPSWLDLDNPRVKIISHEEIFGEGSGVLPTFSSPAIEANLHRIPGLSERFIYFNDDVFLYGDVYVEDFYTRNRGFKVYTAWGADCAHKCEWHMLENGKCEPACFKYDCDYDAGDCVGYLNFSTTKSKHKNNHNLKVPKFNLKTKLNQTSTDTTKDNLYKITNYVIPTENYKQVSSLSGSVISPSLIINSNNSSFSQREVIKVNFWNILSNTTTNLTLHERIKRYNSEKIRSHKILKLIERRKILKKKAVKNQPITSVDKDLYSASLIFTQKLLGRKYGYRRRNVIAHAPLMIDRGIMAEVQEVFPQEFRRTTHSRFRKEDNLQIAFVYSYYLASAKLEKSMEEIFLEYDTDLSGTWSDREIHTLMTRIYALPLKIEMLIEFQNLLENCSKNGSNQKISAPKYERYADSKLSIITKTMVITCQPLEAMLRQFEPVSKSMKYPHEFIEAAEHVSFNQLHSLASSAINTLNNIRKSPRKFVCINDDLDRTNATRADNELLLALLDDFFLSLYPKPSQFELPNEYRNRFARLDDLTHWQRTKWLHISTNPFLVAISVILAIATFVYLFLLLFGPRRCLYFA